jgi:hypothetical protein
MKSATPRYSPRLRSILIGIAMGAVYLFSLRLGFNEAEHRSVALEIPTASADHIAVDVNVMLVDLAHSEMTARISLHLAGKLAQDALTPAVDLKLVLNAIRGQQQFDFPKGKRINPIEVVFPLDGNVNLYPFDQHKGVIWFFATVAGRMPGPLGSKPEPSATVIPAELPKSAGLPVSASALEERVQADTSATFAASIPGLTFRGSRSVQSVEAVKGLTGIEVNLMRSWTVILISITAMAMMAALAIGLVAMVWIVISTDRNMAAFQIPMAVSLIFGLPALRNVQPDIPPPGTFGDLVAFTWAEIAAAASAGTLIAHWLWHRTQSSPPPPKKS